MVAAVQNLERLQAPDGTTLLRSRSTPGGMRYEVVGALQNLLRRGVLSPAEVAADVGQVLATSPNFDPAFPLKQGLSELALAASKAVQADAASTNRG